MHNNYTDIIFTLDMTLLFVSVAIATLIIIYLIVRDYSDRTRLKRLKEIKEQLYAIALSGEASDSAHNTLGTITTQEFLDVEANRRKDAVFFNKTEQDILKDFFVSNGGLKKAETFAVHSANRWQRIEAMMAMGYAGRESSVHILRKFLSSKDPEISYFSALALSIIKSRPAALALLAHLKHSPLMRRKIVSLLASFPDDISDEAARLMQDHDPSIRFWGAKLASKLDPSRHRKIVEKLAQDTDADVRAAACECLGFMKESGSIDVLKECLKDEAWFVRMHAVRALSRTLRGSSIPIIIDMMGDGSLNVLESVMDAMKDNIKSAMPYMQKIFTGTDELAKKIALVAIEMSGYEAELLKILVAENVPEQTPAYAVLKGVLAAGRKTGIRSALEGFDQDSRDKALALLQGIDSGFKESGENNL